MRTVITLALLFVSSVCFAVEPTQAQLDAKDFIEQKKYTCEYEQIYLIDNRQAVVEAKEAADTEYGLALFYEGDEYLISLANAQYSQGENFDAIAALYQVDGDDFKELADSSFQDGVNEWNAGDYETAVTRWSNANFHYNNAINNYHPGNTSALNSISKFESAEELYWNSYYESP